MRVGDSGVGEFIVTGGTASLKKAVVIGYDSTGSGTLALNGGTLEVGGILQPDSYTVGAISVMARTDDGEATPFQGNENIVIEINLIDGCSVNGISISNARQVRISRNTIRHVNLVPSEAGRSRNLSSNQPVSVIRAEATLSDNLFP
jgi:hypothetical protein